MLHIVHHLQIMRRATPMLQIVCRIHVTQLQIPEFLNGLYVNVDFVSDNVSLRSEFTL